MTASANSLRDALAEQSTPDPWESSSWDPQPGDVIAGTLTDRVERTSEQYGSTFEILTLDTEDGEVEVLCARTHLKALLEEAKPKIGDTVAIKYFGVAAGERMHKYALRVDDSPPF